MAIKEHGHIFVALSGQGRPGEPTYTDPSYQAGEYVENGWTVEDRPSEPIHEEVHIGPAVSYVATGTTLWEDREPSEGGNVIRIGNTLDFSGPAEEPDYMNPNRGRDAKAEAIAKAVELAIKNGDIDPEVFDQL